MNGQALGSRHWGLDWLRIGAFALLILYHIAMMFVTWDWHIKSPVAVPWLEWPMRAVNPWRMCLLFLVSGYATRHLLARAAPAAFLGQRLRRMLVPLLFGMAVLVAPQAWVELTVKHGYDQSFARFWLEDYFRFGALHGIILPTWNHLWFLAYLAAYTLPVAAVALLPPLARWRWQAGFDALFAGARLWWLPLGYYGLLYQLGGQETHALADDWYAHLRYLPVFMFGLGLAGNAALAARLAAHWRAALLVAVLAFVARLLIDPAALVAAGLLRAIQTGAALAGLVGLATRHWNRDHRWRAPLARAVFPAYMAHQTVIIVAAFALRPLGWDNGALFAALLLVTLLGCAVAAWLAHLPGGELLGGAEWRAGRRAGQRAATAKGVSRV